SPSQSRRPSILSPSSHGLLSPSRSAAGSGVPLYRSHVFPPLRRMVVHSSHHGVCSGLAHGGHGDEHHHLALGKNPSTLNHTLLFSKMYDEFS
ncbi:hypothetical protein, partial [Citrobacter braakii]|uniref:hypothetical protein n=1 Tax=Citrobacter braakii TaxID=57706 RepID=UPI0019814E17